VGAVNPSQYNIKKGLLMMKIAEIGLFIALLVSLGVPLGVSLASAGAQQDGVPTVKLWKLECAGIGG
jgi:hypothetical protein